MSDVPQGPGWWQASDDRWYPPEAHPDVLGETGRWSDPGRIADPGPLGDGGTGGTRPQGASGPWDATGTPDPGQPFGGPAQPHGAFGQPYGVQPGSYGLPYGGMVPKNEPLAVASLVLGIASIPLICCCYLAIGTGIAAIVTGIMGRRRIADSHGMLEGDGMALAGAIVGGIALALTVGLLVLNIATSAVNWGTY